MTKEFEVTLPNFSGFYCSEYEPNFEIQHFSEDYSPNQRQLIEYNAYNYFNNTAYEKDVAKRWTESFEKAVKDNLTGFEKVSFTFKEVWSPREYNFDTDHIIATIKGVDDWTISMLILQLVSYKDQISEQIKNKFTTRDGFISFMSNDFQTWIKILQGNKATISRLDIDEQRWWSYFMQSIGFLLEQKQPDIFTVDGNIYQDVIESVYPEDYVDVDKILKTEPEQPDLADYIDNHK